MSNEEKRPVGRPRIELTEKEWEMAGNMAHIQATGTEIAHVLGLSYDTFERRLIEKGYQNFAEWYEQKSSGGKISLRRRQYEMSKHNATMALWLGKQWLGQKDKSEEWTHGEVVNINFSDEQVEKGIETARKLKEGNE